MRIPKGGTSWKIITFYGEITISYYNSPLVHGWIEIGK